MKQLKTLAGHSFTVLMGATVALLFSLPLVPVCIAFFVLGMIGSQGAVLQAVVSNPLIGRARQSMGGATFTTWKGLNVLKNKAVSVANPNSDNQQMRRSALGQVVDIFRQMPSVIRAGFKKLAVGKSEFNAFTSDALRNAFDYAAAPAATLVPADLLISKGTIAQTLIDTVTASRAADTIVVTYDNTNTEPGQSASDKALVGVYNSTKGDWTGSATSTLRSAGTVSIAMPESWEAADVIQTYLGFYNSTSGESSDSDTTAGVVAA